MLTSSLKVVNGWVAAGAVIDWVAQISQNSKAIVDADDEALQGVKGELHEKWSAGFREKFIPAYLHSA